MPPLQDNKETIMFISGSPYLLLYWRMATTNKPRNIYVEIGKVGFGSSSLPPVLGALGPKVSEVLRATQAESSTIVYSDSFF